MRSLWHKWMLNLMWTRKKDKRKQELPQPIDATPEELKDALLKTPPKKNPKKFGATPPSG